MWVVAVAVGQMVDVHYGFIQDYFCSIGLQMLFVGTMALASIGGCFLY